MSTPGFRPDMIDGRKASQADCDRLHFLKNTPPVPEINGAPMEFPPFEFRPFPQAMYGNWTDETKRNALRRMAVTLGLNLSSQSDYDTAESALPEFDSRLVENEDEQRNWLSRGWANLPGEVKTMQNKLDELVFKEAAERAGRDNNMSAKAKTEFHAADVANGDFPLVDLPAPKKRGRPAKTT